MKFRIAGAITISMMIINGCSGASSESDQVAPPPTPDNGQTDSVEPSAGDEPTPVPDGAQESTGDSGCPSDIDTIFAAYPDLTVSCTSDTLIVESPDGLPDHDIMQGITSWILRVPIPFAYEGQTAWQFPLEPVWLTEHEATHARGPVAMAVNGVPIYHFDKRPDVELGDSYVYDAIFDTVQQGELDHCGGHAGQGEDYHYHLAPVCLLGDHDLSLPIAFSLGGARIYYGTGATDYYGEGRFNNINNLPDQPLDECNALQLDDGSWVYYTTSTPPYVLGCHHEAVDWRTQIEPRVMRDLSEFGRDHERVISLTYVGDVRTLLFQTTSGQLESVVYYPSDQGENCWTFEFRTEPDTPSQPEVYCRVEQ